MKYFLIAACFLSLQSQAQEACSSVWVFKANKTCSHPSHGPDTGRPGETRIQTEWSKWMRGGKDQLQVCRDVRDGFNGRTLVTGGIAELSKAGPIDERSHRDSLGQVTYTYQCELKVTVYPGLVASSPACGQDEKWSYQVGGAGPEGASCLSCDNLANGLPETMAACLKKHIQEVIEPRAIDLRDSDIASVKTQVKRLLKINKDYRPIANMQSPRDLNLFIEFVER